MAEIITDGVSANPLYYPVTEDSDGSSEHAVSAGDFSLHASRPFQRDHLRQTWIIGPMSQRFMQAQVHWAEMRLWILYHRILRTRRARWGDLMNSELRLACSWYFQSDCMNLNAVYLARKVRNRFCVHPTQKSRDELLQLIFSIKSLC